jgi:hypothetical protein
MNTALKPFDPLSIPTLTQARPHCENAVDPNVRP